MPPESGGHSTIENRHYFLIVMEALCCTFFSNISNGWPGMLEMALRIGVYHSLCDENIDVCDEQRLALNAAYNNASSFWLLGLMAAGVVIDICGPLIAMAFTTVGLTVGALGIALSPFVTSFDLFQCSLLVLWFNGPSCSACGFQVAFVVPEKMSLIFSMMGSLMTLSGLILPTLNLLNGSGIPFHVIWIAFAVLCFVVASLTTVAWAMNMKQLMKVRRAVDEMNDGAVSEHPLHAEPLCKQLLSFEYLVTTIWIFINMPKQILYLGTMRMLNVEIGTESGQLASADKITVMSSWIIPFGAVMIPAIDWMLRKKGIIMTVQFSNFLLTIFDVPQLIPELSVQFISVILFSMYAVWFGSVQTAWLADTFGPKTMARIASTLVPVAVLGVSAGSPLVDMSMNRLGGNFRAIVVLQIIMCLPLPFIFYAVYLKRQMTSSGSNLLGLA